MPPRRCQECGRAFAPDERLDRAQVRAEFGLARVDVDRLFERLPTTALPESRKVYVMRRDIEAYLEDCTYRPGERIRRVA
jgi:hypothetical protein